jgi:hypothetical protein
LNYLGFLKALHQRLHPERYLEIGIRRGRSLAVAECRRVGIDPDYKLTAEIDGSIALYRMTSDDYFAQPDPLAPFDGKPMDLAFIDGMHWFEYALRDFINCERYSAWGSVIILDDMLPRNHIEANRNRETPSWTGDVYKVAEVLRRYRPDLAQVWVDVAPTGTLVLLGANPDDRTLTDQLDDIIATYRTDDPQHVPDGILERRGAIDPQAVIDSPLWDFLATNRNSLGADEGRAALREQVRAAFPTAYSDELPIGAAR